MQSQPIQIRWRIFQGDTLSPLPACRNIGALTHDMIISYYGYQVDKTEWKISHLYMNELKMLVRYEGELENEIKNVKLIGKLFNVNLVWKNCAKILFQFSIFNNCVSTVDFMQ